MGEISLSHDLKYLVIFSLVLILPKLLVQFRIPSGITALLIGVIFAGFDPGLSTDQLFRFLAQIGITSLFVFSGLEVNFDEIREDAGYLLKYLSKWIVLLGLSAFAIQHFFNLGYRLSFIFSLGILTPSAGFIINSLHSFKVGSDQEYWIKSKAISKEIVSIILLFLALQSGDLRLMALSLGFFVGLWLILPPIFKFFFKFISPYAPNTEVPFLVVISLISGVISKELGTYYLVGAFIVGLIGSRFRKDIFKESEEAIFHALNSFFNVFLPFYFFYAGAKLSFSEFNLSALQIGGVFLVIFIPIRIAMNTLSLKFVIKEFVQRPYEISLSLMPTLIFGLVIAGVLKNTGKVSNELVYALVFYTLVSSLLPSILFPIQKRRVKH